MKHFTLLILASVLFLSCAQQKEIESSVADQITVEDGWARPGKAGMMSAAYFRLHNNTKSPDTLRTVSSNVTSNTQIHRSFETEDGLMGMEEQEFVVLPVNSTIEFKQGGLHIMIIQPERDLAEGDSISLILNFSESKDLEIKLPIRSSN